MWIGHTTAMAIFYSHRIVTEPFMWYGATPILHFCLPLGQVGPSMRQDGSNRTNAGQHSLVVHHLVIVGCLAGIRSPWFPTVAASDQPSERRITASMDECYSC